VVVFTDFEREIISRFDGSNYRLCADVWFYGKLCTPLDEVDVIQIGARNPTFIDVRPHPDRQSSLEIKGFREC